MESTPPPGGGPPPLIIKQKTSTVAPAIVALAVIALLGLVLVMGAFVVLALLAPRSLPAPGLEATFVAGDKEAPDEAALIRIQGLILEEEAVGPLWPGREPVARLKKRLERAARDEAKAVILEVDSPGGGITASELIHREIQKFKKAHPGVPVVVQMKDLAASGGYYVSAPADWIVAMPTTLTASIGVILVYQNLQGLFDGKLGIKTRSFVSGKHKDILSPFRDMTEDERKHIQGIVDEMFDRFVRVVIEGRHGKISEEEVRALEGTVLTGRQALEKGLVDQLGALDDAVAKAAELAGVKRLRVVRYDERKSFLEKLLSVGFSAKVQVGPALDLGAHLKRGGSPFLYLWRM